VINEVKTFLINDDQKTGSGTATVALAAGDSFGWFVDSNDNFWGAANLAITASNSSVSAVPEPSNFVVLSTLLGAGALLRRRSARKADV
jgi:hypothetical protein